MITDKMLKAAVAEYGEWSAQEEETWAGGGVGYVTRAGKVVLRCEDADQADEITKREAMQAALKAAEAAAWAPIETAPKDGTEILAAADDPSVHGRRYVAVAQWAESPEFPGNFVSGWFWQYAIRPTIWRPLPEMPAR